MVKIILPTYAAKRQDVETAFGLLERTVGKTHEIGLEIIGKPKDFSRQERLKQIAENINSVAKGAYIIVHGFSGEDVYENGNGDMRTQEGIDFLKTYINLGESVDAAYVHVHSSAGYKRELLFGQKSRELNKIRDNLLRCKADLNSGSKIGIENLPSPSMGDVETNPQQVWRDYVDSLFDCLCIVIETGLKITFDTCHYAASLRGEIDLVPAAEYLGEHLYHLHVNDVSGFWKPNESVFEEGLIPGDGRIGKPAFKDFFAYIRENHPDISICAEVHNTDYQKLEEAQESIRRIMKWLS